MDRRFGNSTTISNRRQTHLFGPKGGLPPEKNLVVKAFRAMQLAYGIGPIDIVLEKIVPDGAGLGGGSADAAAAIVGLNKYFNLGLSQDEMAQIAAQIGADCPFFIYNRPMLATDTGTTLSPVEVPGLKGLTLLIVKPESVSISTAAAYAGIKPREILTSVLKTIHHPVNQWQGMLVNDFESSIFPLAPEVEKVKSALISAGAVYASMSGSGSAVFGLFENEFDAQNAVNLFPLYPHYLKSL